VGKLQKAHAPGSAVLATQIRGIKELLPLVERAKNDASIYASRSVELDPLISTLARLVGEYPQSYPLVMPVREAIDEAIEEIKREEVKLANPARYVPITEDLLELKHLGRIFQECYSGMIEHDRTAGAANSIVRRWDEELRILSDTVEPSG
jgi:hypothetical protein